MRGPDACAVHSTVRPRDGGIRTNLDLMSFAHVGQPFVLLPETSDEWSPPDRWEMVNRQGINWFCDQNGGKWAFPFFRWWFFHHTPSICRGSLNKRPLHKSETLIFYQVGSSFFSGIHIERSTIWAWFQGLFFWKKVNTLIFTLFDMKKTKRN